MTTRPLPAHADRYFESQLHLATNPPAPMKRASRAELAQYADAMTVGFSTGEVFLFAVAAVLLAGYALIEEVRHQLLLIGLREDR